MAKKDELVKNETKRESLTLWVSPSWKLKREGGRVDFISPVVLPYEKEGLTKVVISVEEI